MKYKILLVLSVCLVIAPAGPALAEILPVSLSEYPGILRWAAEVERARDAASRAQTGDELMAAYDRLSALYRNCAGCRTRMNESIKSRLRNHSGEENALRQVLESGLADDPTSLASFLLESNRPREALSIIGKGMRQAHFEEEKMALLELLADAYWNLGDGSRAKTIAGRLLKEKPVSPSYCESALKWFVWLGEEAVPSEEFVLPTEFVTKFDHVRELERRRGNDAYVSCLFSHYLIQLDRVRQGLKQVAVKVPDEVESLFPEGIDDALTHLARRTSEPKAKAAILLAVVQRIFVADKSAALALIREARASSSEESVLIGTLQMEVTHTSAQQREELAELALSLSKRYRRYEASCTGCVSYWRALTYPWPEYSDGLSLWRRNCARLMDECPPTAWANMSGFPTADSHAVDVYGGLLAYIHPDEVTPLFMLRLSDSMRATDAARAWEIEREAILHPEFPAMWAANRDGGRQERAELSSDFETALYLELLTGRESIGGCGLDRTGEVFQPFRRAYYELQVGIRPIQRWNEMMSLLQKDPKDTAWRGIHASYFLDRVARASKVVHRENDALEWLTAVRHQYEELRKETPDMSERNRLQQTLAGITRSIEQLRSE